MEYSLALFILCINCDVKSLLFLKVAYNPGMKVQKSFSLISLNKEFEVPKFEVLG